MRLFARADVFLPPIPVLDFAYLGFPLGVVVAVAVMGAIIGLVGFLRRRKIHGCLVAVAALLLFMAADCTAYMVGLHESGEKRRRRREEMMNDAPPPPPPAATSSGHP
jgi:hypothetical protein